MSIEKARAPRGRTTRRTGAVRTLALVLCLAAPAAATETPQVLSAKPGDAVVYLEPAGQATDVLRQLGMERGKSVFLKAGYAVKRVSVGAPEILDVVVLNSTELQLVAKAVGTTNLLIWDPSGKLQAAVDVYVSSAQSQLQSELRRILEVEDITVESTGHATVLKGSVPSAVKLEQALEVSKAYLGDGAGGNGGRGSPGKIVNLLQVGGNQEVMLKVVIAEMSRRVGREFGVNFNALIEAGSGTINVASFLQGLSDPPDASGVIPIADAVNFATLLSGYGALEQLAVLMDALDERGLGKVLAEPTLLARSGETASFLVGGEVPIPVAQGGAFGSITVEFKPFGVGLGFTPTVLGPDRIHLQVAPEVSDIAPENGIEVGGTVIPGFTTRRAATAVDLKDGQSFAIAGLLSESVRELSGRYPLLGDIPILGSLFRSSLYQKNQTELVIIVTPHLAKPLGPGPHALPTDSFIEPSKTDFYLFGRLEGAAGETAEPGGMIGDVGHRVSTTPEGESK
jgi:pilus assembly protein CpaC